MNQNTCRQYRASRYCHAVLHFQFNVSGQEHKDGIFYKTPRGGKNQAAVLLQIQTTWCNRIEPTNTPRAKFDAKETVGRPMIAPTVVINQPLRCTSPTGGPYTPPDVASQSPAHSSTETTHGVV